MKNFRAADKSHAGEDEKHDINFHWPYIYSQVYTIEDELNDTSHEIGILEAVNREILDDYDACLYADEPPKNATRDI